VLYRQTPKRSWLARLRRRVLGPGAEERGARAAQRAPVMLRIFRDIPVPSWRIVFPEKLLQFRPLDGLRADLITVAGAPTVASAPACTYGATERQSRRARAQACWPLRRRPSTTRCCWTSSPSRPRARC
jgi:hypothetical protein